jgi:hypothetical protein
MLLRARSPSWGAEVFSTSDGGRTWTESGPLHGPAYGGPASLTFTGPEDGWLLFTTEPAGPARFGQLYRTEDGGRHWALLAAGVPTACDPSPLMAGHDACLAGELQNSDGHDAPPWRRRELAPEHRRSRPGAGGPGSGRDLALVHQGPGRC